MAGRMPQMGMWMWADDHVDVGGLRGRTRWEGGIWRARGGAAHLEDPLLLLRRRLSTAELGTEQLA